MTESSPGQSHPPCSIRSVKGIVPFRLGCTSYVIPDDILPNVRYMASVVDDMELVLFESPDYSNIPDMETLTEIARIAAETSLSFTVHLPIDRQAGSADRKECEIFAENAVRIIKQTTVIQPFAFILHLEGVGFDSDRSSVKAWKDNARYVIDYMLNKTLIEPSLVAVENLGYPPEWHLDLIDEFGLSACIDIGHLWLYEQNWKQTIDFLWPRARVVHLHGVKNGKDHISLANGPQPDIFEFLASAFTNFKGVCTLELFNETDTVQSIEIVRNAWEKQC